jgi:CBS domain-containing protein
VDPLEILFVREVMRQNVVALPDHLTAAELPATAHIDRDRRGQLLYPVVDGERRLCGVITRKRLEHLLRAPESGTLAALSRRDPVVAYADEPLRLVVYRMAETGLTRMPVVEREDTRKLVGMVSLTDLLRARTRMLEEERRRERVLRIRFPSWGGSREVPASERS